MKNQVVCPHCKHQWILPQTQAVKTIHCPECHAKLILDEKSSGALTRWQYLITLAVSVLMIAGIWLFEVKQALWLIIIALLVAVVSAVFGDDLYLFIVYKTHGLNYRLDPASTGYVQYYIHDEE